MGKKSKTEKKEANENRENIKLKHNKDKNDNVKQSKCFLNCYY